jgi:hypothetical protein
MRGQHPISFGWDPVRSSRATLVLGLVLTCMVASPALAAFPRAPERPNLPLGSHPTASSISAVSASRGLHHPLGGNLSCSSGTPSSCPHLTAGLTLSDQSICPFSLPNCPVGYDTRATLFINATGAPVPAPSETQIIFVLETTAFTGTWDPLVGGWAAGPCNAPCDESNGVAYFVANAGRIASTIAEELGANATSCAPGSAPTVCFGLVDYFSTGGQDHDDGDGSIFHLDFGAIEPASGFQQEVNQTFWALQLGRGWTYADQDNSDNFLSTSSITALYGAEAAPLNGWSAGATRVVVQIGSSVPRDPNYVDNYNVTNSTWGGGSAASNTSNCEPVHFPNQPLCLGWAEATNSVAAVALQNRTTIDTIDLADGITQLNSGAYVNNGSVAQMDVRNILQAGCDMAVATGGSWEGPSSQEAGIPFTCRAAPAGSGGQGNLSCVVGLSCEALGSQEDPVRNWTSNPSLGWALTHFYIPLVGGTSYLAATGVDGDAFNFIPAQDFELDPIDPAYMVNCTLGPQSPPYTGGGCSAAPNFINLGPNQGFGWAWPVSTMYIGDKMTIRFNLVAKPTYPTALLNLPVVLDACDYQAPTNPWQQCAGTNFGSSTVDFSNVEYDPYNTSGTPLDPPQSFPPQYVTVVTGVDPFHVAAAGSPVLGVAPLTVGFQAEASGGVTPYALLWSFGDGSVGYTEDIAHTYEAPGDYTATFSATDHHGAAANDSVSVWVFPALVGYLNESVNGLRMTSSSEVTLGSTIDLEEGSSGGVPGVELGWTLNETPTDVAGPWWNFTPRGAGTYEVGMEASDSAGNSVAYVDTVVVVPTPPVPAPIVELLANRTSVPVGGSVQFTAQVSGGETPYHLSWQLDGEDLSTQDSAPVLQFTSIGVHAVRVWAAGGSSLPSPSNEKMIYVGLSNSTEPTPSTPAPKTVDPGDAGGPGLAELSVWSLSVFGLCFVLTAWANLSLRRRKRASAPPAAPADPPVPPREFYLNPK